MFYDIVTWFRTCDAGAKVRIDSYYALRKCDEIVRGMCSGCDVI